LKAESEEQRRVKAKAAEAIAAAEAQTAAAKAEAAAVRTEAEEKARSYAAALTQAEEKLAKAKEEARTKAIAREKAEENLKTEREEQQRAEAQAEEKIKTFNQIRQYVFQPGVIKRKFAFISTLAIISVIAISFVVSVANGPQVAIGDATAILEDTPVVTTDVPTSDTGVANGTLIVNPVSPKIAKLTVLDSYNQRNKETLPADGKTYLVQSRDNNRLGTNSGSYTSYDFSDLSIPTDATIKSVVIFVEHFEEEGFANGKLKWAVGTGWPTKPVVWAELNAPVYEGESNEAVDSWDVTSVVDTREKINSLQLQVKNNDTVAHRKTSIDYTYVVVECD
jgi:hypothetical protein